jgi:hypothetical protein
MQPTASSPHTTYWRPMRLAALFSLFSRFAITLGVHSYWLFLMFLFFLLPFPVKPRARPCFLLPTGCLQPSLVRPLR